MNADGEKDPEIRSDLTILERNRLAQNITVSTGAI
jgi:hypothetical protein